MAGSLLLLELEAVLTGLDGRHQAFNASDRKATVVVFVSTVCPVSSDYHPRIARLWAEYGAHRDVNFLVVYPNKTEPLDEVRRHAEEMKFPFPVYRDDNNVLADKLGARFTPTAVVYDAKGVRYLGAIDDATNPARVKRSYLREAIKATLAGRPPAVASREPYG